MSFVYTCLLALAYFGSAQAAPTPANLALARRYAPQFRFHKDEYYWPSTVDFFLGNTQLLDNNGAIVQGQPLPLTKENVDDVNNKGTDMWISAADIKGSKNGFLRGQNPANGGDQPATYTFIVEKNNGVVDLYYWLFYPFNEAKKVPVLGQVGDHVGDWERLTVRTVNGIATQVDYHAHGDTGSGTLPWNQITKFDNDQRPVGYVARGSHGLWVRPGSFTYLNAVVFQLKDDTSDGGVSWDTRDSIVGIQYPSQFEGELDWLNFRGKWGNKGNNKCWWYFAYKGCEIVDAPGGPVRDDVLSAAKFANPDGASAHEFLTQRMSGPLSQTLATISSDASSSRYTIRLNAQQAPIEGHTTVIIEQRCAPYPEQEEEESQEETEAEISSVTGSTPLVANQLEYTVNTASCPEGSTVAAYTVGLCNSDDESNCFWSSGLRTIRAFSEDPTALGVQQTGAVIVDDLDDWEW